MEGWNRPDERFDAAADLVKGLAKTLKPDWTAAASVQYIDEPFWRSMDSLSPVL